MCGGSVAGTRWGSGGESFKDDRESRRGEEGVDAKTAIEGFAADKELAQGFDGGVASRDSVRWRSNAFVAVGLGGVLACYDWSEQLKDGEVVNCTGGMS